MILTKQSLVLLIFFWGFSLKVFAYDAYWICPPQCPSKPSYKEVFFDFNKDGYLNDYESSLLRTHKELGWPKAQTRTQKKFDLDGDHLLNPWEYQSYKNSKKSFFKNSLRQ